MSMQWTIAIESFLSRMLLVLSRQILPIHFGELLELNDNDDATLLEHYQLPANPRGTRITAFVNSLVSEPLKNGE
jgi:hypothetical protein